jgi:hypothetical protein
VSAGEVALVVEITSPSNAVHDRRPQRERAAAAKGSGYAKAGIPHCLLIDRAPNVEVSTLFTDPDRQAGVFGAAATWKFGESIRLPEPLGLEIATDGWAPWAE